MDKVITALVAGAVGVLGAVTPAANAQGYYQDTTCRAWENGREVGRAACKVVFDEYGAKQIFTEGYILTRGSNGVGPGVRNKECLRRFDKNIAICPIGNYN